MKGPYKKAVLLVLIVAFASVIWWFLRYNQTARINGETVVRKTAAKVGEANSKSAGSRANVSDTAVRQHDHTVEAPSVTNQLQPELFFLSENVPIVFWGKVIDQDGKPLPGVRVVMTVRQWHMSEQRKIRSEFLPFELTTGSEGRFEVSEVRGDVLTVKSVEKLGFEASPRGIRSFGYNISTNFTPDVDSPFLFRMWKVLPGEPLIAAEKFYGIIPDGRTYTLDFAKGKKIEGESEEGDVKINISRPARVQPRERFDWSFQIEPINGGIIETHDEFMYLAPESGYEPLFQASFDSTSTGWQKEVLRHFYLQSRGGQMFARLEVEVLADYNGKSIFIVKSHMNPAGSRNLRP